MATPQVSLYADKRLYAYYGTTLAFAYSWGRNGTYCTAQALADENLQPALRVLRIARGKSNRAPLRPAPQFSATAGNENAKEARTNPTQRMITSEWIKLLLLG